MFHRTYPLRLRPGRTLLLLAALAAPLPAQTASQIATQTAAAPGPAAVVAPAQEPPRTQSAKEAREAQLAADTEKLYQLAQELKTELDKSNKDTLSISVVKKAAEIEKLAHSISARMKTP
jgi:hypothetical protein